MPKAELQSKGHTWPRHEDPRMVTGFSLSLVPPIELDLDLVEDRYEKLAAVTAEYTIPRLLALHGQTSVAERSGAVLGIADVHELGRLVLGPDGDLATGFLLKLKDRGVSLDDLHSELLGPTASYLGELWSKDRVDFVDVTLGVARLQRLVIAFEGLDPVFESEEKRKILVVGAPEEQHSLGNAIIQRFFRASGWQVWSCITPRLEEVARISSEDWFGIVGFSLSLDAHFEGLRNAIKRIRAESLNPSVGIIVGGSAIARNPHWVEELGADGTAENGPSAVVLAKKLLAKTSR